MAEPMTAGAIRQRFLQYFKDKGRTFEPLSALVPGDNPTLLFTHAGMVPFKHVFLGCEQRPYTRATSPKRCVHDDYLVSLMFFKNKQYHLVTALLLSLPWFSCLYLFSSKP
jgi:hypothetical protein